MINNNNSILNTIKKSINDYGQSVGFSTITSDETPYTSKAIVKMQNDVVQQSDMMMLLRDKYLFILLDKVDYEQYIYWNESYYKILSIDNTTPNVYKVSTQFNNKIVKHTYDMKLNEIDIDTKVNDIITLNIIYYMDGKEIPSDNTQIFIPKDSSMLQIDNDKNIKAIKEGSTTIEIKWKEITKTVNINIAKADEYNIEQPDISLDVGKSTQLTPICKKNGVEVLNQTVNYTIDDNSIANIDENGLVNAIKEGSTTINISWNGVTIKVNVVVNATLITYTIDGVEEFNHKTQQTYTINPMVDNSKIEVDPVDIEAEIVSIVSKSNGTITVYGIESTGENFFTLFAFVNDVKVAEKVVTVKGKGW